MGRRRGRRTSSTSEDEVVESKGPSRSGPQGGGGRRNTAGEFASLAKRPLFPVSVGTRKDPVVRELKTVSGGSLSTFYSRDPIRTQKAEAIILPYVNSNMMTSASSVAFQSNGATVIDPSADAAGREVTNIFQQLVDLINFSGKFTPNELLQVAADWGGYLQFYTMSFSALWAYWSVLSGLGINASFRSFGTGCAAQGLLDRVAVAWDRLQLIPIPPMFPKMLSEIFGVYYGNEEDWGFVTYMDPNSSLTVVTDWTSTGSGAGTITSLINAIDGPTGFLTSLENSTNEANQIQEIISRVYGPPEPLPKPMVWEDPLLFDQHYCRLVKYLVTNMFAQPQITALGAGGTVPLLVRKGQEGSKYASRMASFLRPAFYDASAVNGSLGTHGSDVGFCTGSAALQDYSRYYGPGPNNNTIYSDSSFAALNYGNATFVEIEWWAAFVQSTSGVLSWVTDSRAYDRWDVLYPNSAFLGSNTNKELSNLFFTGLNGRGI
jgi:hypothetical protein